MLKGQKRLDHCILHLQEKRRHAFTSEPPKPENQKPENPPKHNLDQFGNAANHALGLNERLTDLSHIVCQACHFDSFSNPFLSDMMLKHCMPGVHSSH